MRSHTARTLPFGIHQKFLYDAQIYIITRVEHMTHKMMSIHKALPRLRLHQQQTVSALQISCTISFSLLYIQRRERERERARAKAQIEFKNKYAAFMLRAAAAADWIFDYLFICMNGFFSLSKYQYITSLIRKNEKKMCKSRSRYLLKFVTVAVCSVYKIYIYTYVYIQFQCFEKKPITYYKINNIFSTQCSGNMSFHYFSIQIKMFVLTFVVFPVHFPGGFEACQI